MLRHQPDKTYRLVKRRYNDVDLLYELLVYRVSQK